MNLENEIWKTIINCEDYQVSSLGRVKNVNTNIFLNPYEDYFGYQKISLYIKKKSKEFKVHRLIAIHFISNPQNKPTVHHINKIKNDNRIENLEWATMSEQNLAINKKEKNYNFCKADNRNILKINIDNGEILEKYNSIKDAAKWIFDKKLTKITEFNKLTASIISSKLCAVANDKRNNAYGYKWKYYNEKETMENEIWKEIPLELTNNKPNYFISSLGRFKNNKGQIINNYKHSTGYKRLVIKNNCYLLHRLVALTFLSNPENKQQVNHIDGNKLNNCLENLEWVTSLENNLHKIKNGLSNHTKKVIQYDENMIIINKFDSIVDASNALKITRSSISDNCRGKTQKTKSGFYFRYANL